jgi:hypothetical protein
MTASDIVDRLLEVRDEPDSPYDIDSFLDEPEDWQYPLGFKAVDPDSDRCHTFTRTVKGYRQTHYHTDPYSRRRIDMPLGDSVVPRHQAKDWIQQKMREFEQHGWRIEPLDEA